MRIFDSKMPCDSLENKKKFKKKLAVESFLFYSVVRLCKNNTRKGKKMKFLWIFSCLLLCACMNNGRRSESYDDYDRSYRQDAMYNQPYAAPVAVQQPVATPEPFAEPEPAVQAEVAVNPYALEPHAYEQNINVALTKKEEELFIKEKHLMDAQQELYEREKKLADREAAFIDRSKALDYKEKNIMSGRSYAPTSVEIVVPAPAQAPVMAPPPAPVPAQVYRVEPPAPYVENPYGQDYAQPQPMGFDNGEDILPLSNYSQPAEFEVQQNGYIILQHPIQRDLVRCPITDDVCLESYERLGYVRSANLSRFTAQDELDTAGTYPTNATGQWRENNNIPRW